MPARYETIASWVNEFNWKRGAELGVFDGTTHNYLLAHCPQLNLVGVDVWDANFKEGETKSGERCFCPYCSETRASRKRAAIADMRRAMTDPNRPFANRSQIYIETTAQLAERFEPWTFDFVFVDADHSTEGVSDDIARWRSRIRPGGRLIGHDWNMESVRAGVMAHYKSKHVRTDDDHLWWVVV